MNPAISIWHAVERRLARISEKRTAELTCDTGIVCFTFDDVWQSACIRGSAILENHNARGTFYVCGGLMGTGEFHRRVDLHRLVNNGHEIGCHGYGHRRYQSISATEILADVQKNHFFFEELGLAVPRHFAYPYGEVSPFVKRIVGREFYSSRGIVPGINHSTVDLALLKSFPLFDSRCTKRAIVKLSEENAKRLGLSIFFTHGVRSNPNEIDCSPDLLDFAIRTSIASGNAVLPVGDAMLKCKIVSNRS